MLKSGNKAWLKKRIKVISFLRNQFATIHNSPIIVLGNQKSGTSAIAHLLADFGGLSKTIDIPPIWGSFGCGAEILHGQKDFASVVKSHKAYFSTKVIKEPMMTFFVDQVMGMFPACRYVYVVRDPRDNIRSVLNRRGIRGHLGELQEQDIPGPDRNKIIVRFITDSTLWGGEEENYVGVLAHKWNKAADSYLAHQDRMVLAKYEDFLKNKCRFIAKLAEWLGISKRNNIEDRVDIQYQPRGKDRDVLWEEFFGQENLKRIERICGSRMRKFGYS